jgi:serine/threonine protein kinase
MAMSSELSSGAGAEVVPGTKASAGSAGAFTEELPRSLGRYLLLRRIARGGMGEVFLASTTGLEGAERPVVVKIIRREHARDPSFIARFLDEARVQAQLQHSGVAQVLEATIDDRTGEPYAVVEYVEGKSLGDLRGRAVQTGHAIGWADAVAIATLVAEALAHVHERQDASGRALAIVHRDLSPQNVMVSFAGDCKIIDFGTARGQNRRCHTVAGVVFAKPGYVAPEVANGDPGDARVDLYALGVMLWELCAGRRFLQGDASAHMAQVARNAKNPPPLAAALGAPEELDAIIAKLTTFDRDQRYLAARAAGADLARLLGAAPPLPNGERGVRARTAQLMKALFASEQGRTRREFERLVAAARELRGNLPTPKGGPATAAPEGPASAPGEDEEGLLPGTRYRLLREVGRGSSSVVHEAEHVDLGRRVALKVLGLEHSRSADFAARFRREARALAKLRHDGLVVIHDVGQASDGRLFCVMDLLDGETLEAFLARERGVDWREALGIARRALDALEVAHAAGIVHRDVKPANLFLLAEGGLKILDFGLAKGPDDGGATDASKRAGFTLFGTPEYMAPEQAALGQIDARADLYAVGCVLYEMITGRLPFVGPSSVAILDAKIKGSPERPRDRAPARGIPEAVDELVVRALARHPSVRFQTASELRQAIDAALAEPARQRARRRRAGLGAIAAMLALGAVLVAGKAPGLRPSLPWSRTPATTQQLDVAKATPPAAPAEDPAVALDEGEDGDIVDDTLPTPDPASASAAAPASAAASAAAPASASAAAPASASAPVAAPAHPKKKHVAPARAAHAPRPAAAPKAGDAAPAMDAPADAPSKEARGDRRKTGPAKIDRPPRRRHKARVAAKEP